MQHAVTFDTPPPGARVVELDRLPSVSPWPARLLGLAPWKTRERTVEYSFREYEKEKYARVHEWLETAPRAARTVAGAQQLMEIAWQSGPAVVSFRDRLYEVERAPFDVFLANLVADAVLPFAEGADAIIELGCGFGYQLSFLRGRSDLRFAGGDLSPNAVSVAEALHRPEDRAKFVVFDYYDAASYERVLDASGGRRATIFTSFSAQQLPTAAPFLENLRRHRDRVHSVVHLEPTTKLFSSGSLLDQLRLAYARENDYNVDLQELLEDASDIVIERREKDLLGQNPLAPINLVSWRFR